MSWLGWVGPASLSIVLVLLALLSRRLGRVTRATPYYGGLLVGAGFVLIGAFGRLQPQPDPLTVRWVLLSNGMIALGLTLSVIFAWRYWSWLLAERD